LVENTKRIAKQLCSLPEFTDTETIDTELAELQGITSMSVKERFLAHVGRFPIE